MDDGFATLTVASPVGRLLLAATDRGLVRVAFEVEGLAGVREAVARELGLPEDQGGTLGAGVLADSAHQVGEFLAGRRHAFDLPLDRRLSHGFRAAAQTWFATIPYGQTRTYADVAAALNSPRAVRAVGSACASNPLPLVLPCHRVVRSDGGLGGYLGGLEAKRYLLALEAAHA